MAAGPPDRPLTASLAAFASLLSASDAAATRVWQANTDQQLRQQVNAYQTALAALQACIAAQAGDPAASAAPQGAPAGLADGTPRPCPPADSSWQPPPHSTAVQADVRSFDWPAFCTQHGGFDVVMMDPPWQLATANPTRGVALKYNQLSDVEIQVCPARPPARSRLARRLGAQVAGAGAGRAGQGCCAVLCSA
jgi:hypothetical protein